MMGTFIVFDCSFIYSVRKNKIRFKYKTIQESRKLFVASRKIL